MRREQYKIKEFIETILKNNFLKDKLKEIRCTISNEKKYNTKIELNGQTIFLADSSGELEKKLFYLFINKADQFSLNDSGKDRGLRIELHPFDISSDKETGHEWTFKVNKKSKEVIIKTFKSYRTYPHLRWALIGKSFFVDYKECGDDAWLMDGPNGKETVNNFFKITVKNEALKMILAILKLYPQIIK